MNTFVGKFLALLALVLATCSAFQVVVPSHRLSSTNLSAYGGKKPKKPDQSFLAGRGARITVREDEDAAMWVEEPDDKKKKKGGAKGKPKKKGWFS